MSVLPELEKRLAENEKRIAVLMRDLEDHAKLEESLRAAGSGLKEANTEVRSLAESAKVANESLAAVLASFQDAVALLRKSDPARATEAVTRVDERLKNAEREIVDSIGEVFKSVSGGQEKAAHQLSTEAQAIRETIGNAASAVSSGQERAEHQLKAEAQAIRKSIPTAVTYMILVLVLGLVGFEILRHFPTLLSQ